jgi:DnaJ-class molecular chaperone
MEYTRTTQVTFLQVIDDKSFVIQCRYCEGQGRNAWTQSRTTWKLQTWREEACCVCSGKGFLRLESDDIPTNCGPCHGTGRNVIDDRQRDYGFINSCALCRNCGGLGVLSLTGKIKKLS